MLQAIVKKGKVFGEEIPIPKVSKNSLLIKVINSCISTGTEKSGVANSSKSLIQKAKEKPEKVAKVVNKLKSDGLASTISMVKNELSTGATTGYSLSGTVVEVGSNVDGFEIGDYVAVTGKGHAEYVTAPSNLVCKIPKNLSFEEASTVALGSIAMQGVRRADLKLGEMAIVYGAGIIGLLIVQMLKASGVRVAAIDLEKKKLELAKKYGAEIVFDDGDTDVVESINNWTGGFGADAVLFTAATSSSEPLSHSFKMCKRRGRVILVGVSGMSINRADIYNKELDFQMSTSYGPGRYDKSYEENGVDYPYAYVRWTANRNMQDYLRLLNEKQITISELITHRFSINQISEAYQKIQSKEENPLMVILEYYKKEHEPNISQKVFLNKDGNANKNTNVALVGAGSFAKSVHLPNIEKLNNKYNLYAVMNTGGYNGKSLGNHFGAKYVTSNYDDILRDQDIDLIMISTRHDSHAELVIKALKSGKNVFVEKPLATNSEELKPIIDFYNSNAEVKPLLMVGFNRRFSPYITEIKKLTNKRINPLVINYRMNAGFVPLDHWIHEGGGRIVGEACHIIDLISSITNSKIRTISVENLTPANNKYSKNDNRIILLKYEDGSVATISYFAVGSKSLSKEYMELHFDNKSIVLDDYQSLKGFGVTVSEPKRKELNKGHIEELEALHNSLTNKNAEWPIPFWNLIQTTEATFMVK